MRCAINAILKIAFSICPCVLCSTQTNTISPARLVGRAHRVSIAPFAISVFRLALAAMVHRFMRNKIVLFSSLGVDLVPMRLRFISLPSSLLLHQMTALFPSHGFRIMEAFQLFVSLSFVWIRKASCWWYSRFSAVDSGRVETKVRQTHDGTRWQRHK